MEEEKGSYYITRKEFDRYREIVLRTVQILNDNMKRIATQVFTLTQQINDRKDLTLEQLIENMRKYKFKKGMKSSQSSKTSEKGSKKHDTLSGFPKTHTQSSGHKPGPLHRRQNRC